MIQELCPHLKPHSPNWSSGLHLLSLSLPESKNKALSSPVLSDPGEPPGSLPLKAPSFIQTIPFPPSCHPLYCFPPFLPPSGFTTQVSSLPLLPPSLPLSSPLPLPHSLPWVPSLFLSPSLPLPLSLLLPPLFFKIDLFI